MSKRIKIIEYCGDCEKRYKDDFGVRRCRATGSATIVPAQDARYIVEQGIPDWCPLPKLPEPRTIYTLDKDGQPVTTNDVLALGWNACLDEIEGGEEDE